MANPRSLCLAAVLAAAGVLIIANLAVSAEGTADSDAGQLVVEPGYDVPEGARDPFFQVQAEPEEQHTPGEEPKEEPPKEVPVAIDELVNQVRINGLAAGEKSGNAIINGRLYYRGDSIAVTQGGEAFVLTVVRFAHDPPGVVLGFDGQEKLLTVAEKTDGGAE